jgi:ribosomal protein L11 methyltransferase
MVELTLLCVAANAEAVSDALIDELGALSASVEDADAGTDAEQALFGEPGMAPPGSWDRSVVKALFLQADDAQQAMDDLRAIWGAAVHLRSIAPVPDQDWVTLTQAQFPPTEITTGFWIVPSWHEPPPEATRVIRLDPGMAFGTGTHPTTRMCLRWLARRSQDAATRWRRALDYGCGSGILAIGAARCGAASIDAVDIDPHCGRGDADQRTNQRSVAARRSARLRARQLQPRPRQHPRDAAEVAGAGLVRPS